MASRDSSGTGWRVVDGMTAGTGTTVADGAPPIVATMATIDAALPYQAVRYDPDTGLRSLSRLLADDGAGVHEQLANMSAYLKTEDGDILVSLAAMSFPWLIASVAFQAVYGAGRLPDLHPDTTCYDFAEYGYPNVLAVRSPRFRCLPGDPDADHPDAEVVSDRAALVAAAREAIDAHVAPVLAVFRSRGARVGLGTLRRTAREAALSALCDTAATLGRIDDLGADIAEVFEAGDAATNPLYLRTLPTLREYPTGSGTRRASIELTTCCLRFRIPGRGTCPSCPNQPAAEREERMAESARLYG